jgi:hypothetical protein
MFLGDMIYDLTFINNLTSQLKNNNEIAPESSITEIIQLIYKQVGNPNYVKTPVFTKSEYKDDARRKKKFEKPKQMLSNDDIKKYVPVTINREVNNVDQIRSLLNKLTDKNYNELVPKILQALHEIDEKYSIPECTEDIINENKVKIGELIFNICSTNRFYSRNFAEIFSVIANKYTYVNDIFLDNLNRYKLQFDNIKYVDSSDNYDEFCMINKLNEKRRAFTMFIVNLNAHDFVSKECIIELTKHLFGLMDKWIDMDNKKNELDELVENICIIYNKLFINDYENIMIKGDAYSIRNLIEKVSICQLKEFKSLSSKSKFKIMDLNEM